MNDIQTRDVEQAYSRDTDTLLSSLLAKHQPIKIRLRNVTNLLYDQIRKADPGLDEDEIRQEMDFIDNDKVGIPELDGKKWGWNVARIRYERYLRQMLSAKRFRRLDIVRGELANLRMQLNLWAALEYIVKRILLHEAQGKVNVTYVVDISSMQIKESDTPRKRYRNCSPWVRESISMEDDVYLPNHSGFVDGRNP